MCINPLFGFADFNHLFSNIFYASFGLLFLWVVYMKMKRYQAQVERNATVAEVSPTNNQLKSPFTFDLMTILLQIFNNICS